MNLQNSLSFIALIADRGWAERRVAGMIRINDLNDRAAFDAFEWGSGKPKAASASFRGTTMKAWRSCLTVTAEDP